MRSEAGALWGWGPPRASPCPRSVTQPRSPRPLLAPAPSTVRGKTPVRGGGRGTGDVGPLGGVSLVGRYVPGWQFWGAHSGGGESSMQRGANSHGGRGVTPHTPEPSQPSHRDPATCLNRLKVSPASGGFWPPSSCSTAHPQAMRGSWKPPPPYQGGIQVLLVPPAPISRPPNPKAEPLLLFLPQSIPRGQENKDQRARGGNHAAVTKSGAQRRAESIANWRSAEGDDYN